MSLSCIEAIKQRRSIRQYSTKEVPREVLMEIIQSALRAPSAGNLQPWHIYVVTDQQKKIALAQAALGQRFVQEAPVVLVVCAEPERSAARYGARGRELYCLQDTANLTYAIMLAATSYGLGTCWVGAFQEQGVQETLGLDSGRRPVAIIPVVILKNRGGKTTAWCGRNREFRRRTGVE